MSLSVRPLPLALTFRARRLDIDSDSILIDVIERPGDAGPQAGLTYAEAYPEFGQADFLQRSSLLREISDFTFDGRLALARKTTFRFGYEFENLKRPFLEAVETKTHTFKLGLNSRLSSQLKLRSRYTYAHADHPFAHIGAALPPALQPFPSASPPNPFVGTQYFTIYDARVADFSNHPEEAHQFVNTLTYSPTDRLALSGHLRAKFFSNSLNDFGDWSDEDISPSFDLWYAPAERVNLLANYSLHHRHSEALFGIAVYDG